MSCTRAQEFLAAAGVEIDERTDARKNPIAGAAVLKLLDDVDEIYAAKGKQVMYFDLKKDRPDDTSLLDTLLGPSGNLRAPTVRKGRTLIVGFSQEMYRKTVGVSG